MNRNLRFLQRRVVAAVIATLVGVALAVIGVSIWPLAIVATALWVLVVASRWQDYLLAVPSVVVASGLVLLGVLSVLPVTGLPLYPSFVVLWALCALAAAAMLADSRAALSLPPFPSMVVWLSPLAGSVVWLASIALSALVPAATHYSWVTNGDSANNILFAREIVYRDGIAIGPDQNPVPLPAGILALSMSAGRAATPVGDLLRHDVAGFVVVWGLVIASVCYFAGLAASTAVSRSRPWLVAAAGAGVSLIPLSWYVGGYPIEFGFFSVHVALSLIFICWLVCLSAARAPAVVLATLMGASTLLLAVWSPLVVMPVALGVYVVVSRFRALLATRGVPLVLLTLALLQVLAYGLGVTLPSLLAQAEFLSANGGIYPFSQLVVFGVLGCGLVVVVLVLLARRGGQPWMLGAVLLASGLGLGALLFLNRAGKTPWTYYPVKFAWLASVIVMVLILGAVIGLVSRIVRRRLVAVLVLVVLAGATILTLDATGKAVPSYVGLSPTDRLFATAETGGGDAVIKRIFEYANPDHPTILWASHDLDEGSLNFWTLQIAADSTTGKHALRVFAYGYYDLNDVGDLCKIVKLIDRPVTVQTTNAQLPADAAAKCAPTAARMDFDVRR